MDLGLPSGTFWLDRLVGAESPSSPGLYYQWGAVIGHTATDEFRFYINSYIEQGLNTIDSDLTEDHDAARAFYGQSAKMPTVEQIEEFLQNTSIDISQRPLIKFTSLINGNSIFLYGGGFKDDRSIIRDGELRTWLINYIDNDTASSLHESDVSFNYRFTGLNIMAVHS